MNMSMPARWSLRRTLLALVLTLTVSIWCFSAVVVYLDADTESRELFDQSLSETGHLLLALADHELEEHVELAAPTLTEIHDGKHSKYLLFQIWDGKHRLIYRSAGAPETAFTSLSLESDNQFGWIRMEGQEWRTYSSWNARQNMQIQVAEPSSHRKEISSRFAYKLMLFALLVVPLLVVGLWWSVNRVFRSLQTVANEVSQRMPGDLHQLNLRGAPTEIHPLLHAINRLFERVSQTLEREQRFTADAAHELRTPLAAIKTNLQVIQRARNDNERAEAAAGLGTSVDRATRLVGQLMTLAKLEPPYDKNLVLQETDLANLLQPQMAGWQTQAEKAQISFSAELQSGIALIHAESILILFRNLMDNALRYTPVGGRVQVSCGQTQNSVYLRIADNGAGIPEDMRERVFQRFVRLSDATIPGSGLGLSIVKSIADNHHATLTLAEGLDERGLGVTLVFPLYAAAVQPTIRSTIPPTPSAQ